MSVYSGVKCCKTLVLDSGPLLSLSSLQGLAEEFITVPQVLDELKDVRAREHFKRLGLITGARIKIQSPDASSLAHVIRWAKKTGDYSVLSHADICVLALTYLLHEKGKLEDRQDNKSEISTANGQTKTADQLEPEPIQGTASSRGHPFEPIFNDPSVSDDSEGEWITPSNVLLHKSRALNFLPDAISDGRQKGDGRVLTGCMTADFAMQNVLLQMGLNLVGSEGKRIEKLKSWVLRCHACFKICKDNSKKFCPSCGNPTLLRASVTVVAPRISTDGPTIKVHLKKNFQYNLRGTKYSIPDSKAGSAKTGAGRNLILREDQPEYLRAKKRVDGKREREEAKLLKGILNMGIGVPSNIGSWMDPDWAPELLSGGKGRTTGTKGMCSDLPQIGYGKKNPNERRKRK